MEIEIASENLIGAFSAEHHLYAHRLDDASQQIHRRRSTHGGNIVSLDVIDDVADGIKTFLNGIIDFMVDSTDVVGNEACLCQVGSTFQTNGKRVQTGPVGTSAAIILYAVFTELLGNGRDDTGVETAGEKYAVRHVGHQLPTDSILKGIVNDLHAGFVILYRLIFKPVTLIIALHSRFLAPIVMSGQERLIMFTLTLKGFEFRCDIDRSVIVVANI